jgi:ABC-type bacteriocin/lantibiotic exporter with double-glycine peptidase domain
MEEACTAPSNLPRRGVSVVSASIQPLVWALAAVTAHGFIGHVGAAPPPRPSPPAAHQIEHVPFAEPHDRWCGPSALAAVLQYHGDDVTASEIARDVYLADRRGSLNLDLLLWSRRRGYRAHAVAGSTDALRRTIAADLPVICMLRRRGPLADQNHFVVVRGYDDRGAWLADLGQRRQERLAGPDFQRSWSACDHWMLVVEGGRSIAEAPGDPE